MDIGSLMKAKSAWNTFKENHPKFPLFLNDLKRRGISSGSVVEFSVKYPDGSTMKTNFQVSDSDMELLKTILK